MIKAVKIRIYPTEEQKDYLINLFGSSRFIYNKCLSYKQEQYDEYYKSVSYSEIGKYLTNLKTEHTWLKNVHSKVLQQSLRDMEVAYKNFFNHKFGFPKFKKRSDKQSVRFPIDAFVGVRGNRIDIIRPLKNILFKCSVSDEKYLNNNYKQLRNSTLSKTRSGKYYLSILIDRVNTKVLPKTDNMIGIDLGIKDFVITSEGEVFDNIKIKRNNQSKLKKLHQNLSKKKLGSKNRNKARVKLARFYEKLNNIKEYYLHSVVNQLINENQVIVVENLNVKGMLKNHNLARSVSEVSFSRFINILEYKSNWYGREIIKVGRFFPSSKLCSICGTKNNDLTLNDREWECVTCSSVHDRDINASINILNEGKRIKIGMSSPELTLVESGQ